MLRRRWQLKRKRFLRISRRHVPITVTAWAAPKLLKRGTGTLAPVRSLPRHTCRSSVLSVVIITHLHLTLIIVLVHRCILIIALIPCSLHALWARYVFRRDLLQLRRTSIAIDSWWLSR